MKTRVCLRFFVNGCRSDAYAAICHEFSNKYLSNAEFSDKLKLEDLTPTCKNNPFKAKQYGTIVSIISKIFYTAT